MDERKSRYRLKPFGAIDMEWYKIDEGPLDDNYGKYIWISDGKEVFIDPDFDNLWDLEMRKNLRWAPIEYPDVPILGR